jgi:AmmeMemoRadiSam system protein B
MGLSVLGRQLFDKALSDLEVPGFLNEAIAKRARHLEIYVAPDFHFGRGAEAKRRSFYYNAEKAWRKPLGPLPLETALNDLLLELNPLLWEGPTNDNAIEVSPPLIRFYFPKARLWPVRVPPTPAARNFGEKLAAWLNQTPKPVLAVGFTDLTYYGLAYGFAAVVSGPAVEEFRRNNDGAFIEAALVMES